MPKEKESIYYEVPPYSNKTEEVKKFKETTKKGSTIKKGVKHKASTSELSKYLSRAAAVANKISGGSPVYNSIKETIKLKNKLGKYLK